MRSFPLKHDRSMRIAGVVGLLAIWPMKFGAAQVTQSTQEYVQFACQNLTVKVVPTTGTDPKAVYLCGGNTLTWDANGHTFIVVFRKASPFEGDQKVFDNTNYKSKPAKHTTALTVYNYDIVVDGQPIDDPQVVGGGGH